MADLKLGYLNSVALIGRVTQDPEVKYTPKGTPVCGFRLAVSRRYRDKETGEWKEDASFFNISTFGRQAELCGDYLKKGSAVLLEGRLRSRSWETQTGDKRYAVDVNAFRVQFLDKVTPEAEPAEPAPEEEPEVPKEKLDDLPF
jgi:single-strand DNA-binding protein